MVGPTRQLRVFVLILGAALAACSSGFREPGAGLEPGAWTVTKLVPVRVAQAGPAPGQPAARGVTMKVTAWRGSRIAREWKGQTRWRGALMLYRAKVKRGKLEWIGAAAVGVRVNTNASGAGGQSLESWLPRGTTEVFVRISQPGSGKSPGGGAGSEKARAGTPRKPDVQGRASDGSRGSAGRAGSGSSAKARGPAGSKAGGSATAGRTAGRRGQGSAGSSAGKGGSRAGTGSKYGRPGGDGSGHEQGRRAELGGVADAYASRTTGEAFGDKEGARGGDGSAGDAGARGAFALFGGILNLPREWRAAVEVALVGADVLSPGAAFKAIVKKGVGRLAVVQVRNEIRAEAAAFAKAEVKRLQKRFRRKLKQMPADERERLLRATEQMKERQYFDKVEQGAKNRRRHLERKLQRDRNNARLRAELRDARKIEDAAAVKPVEGRFPRNHEYAGTLYRVDNLDPIEHAEAIKLIKGKRRAGVHFSRQGYPDFTPWMYKHGHVAADVRIVYTGSRNADFRAARDAMRKRLRDPTWQKPAGYTWHHHEDVGRMMLVPFPIHQAVSHTGGIPFYRMTTGAYDAYP